MNIKMYVRPGVVFVISMPRIDIFSPNLCLGTKIDRFGFGNKRPKLDVTERGSTKSSRLRVE